MTIKSQVLLCCILVLLSLATTRAQVRVAFGPYTIKSAANIVHIQNDEGFSTGKFYQFGASSHCNLIQPQTESNTASGFDPIGSCFLESERQAYLKANKNTNTNSMEWSSLTPVANFISTGPAQSTPEDKSQCLKFNIDDEDGGYRVAQLTFLQPVSRDEIITCLFAYTANPIVGNTNNAIPINRDEFVLYRSTTTEESGIIPIELKSTFPKITDSNPGFVYYHGKSGSTEEFLDSQLILQISKLPPGLYPLQLSNDFIGIDNSNTEIYCYEKNNLNNPQYLLHGRKTGRFYLTNQGDGDKAQLFLHSRFPIDVPGPTLNDGAIIPRSTTTSQNKDNNMINSGDSMRDLYCAVTLMPSTNPFNFVTTKAQLTLQNSDFETIVSTNLFPYVYGHSIHTFDVQNAKAESLDEEDQVTFNIKLLIPQNTTKGTMFNIEFKKILKAHNKTTDALIEFMSALELTSKIPNGFKYYVNTNTTSFVIEYIDNNIATPDNQFVDLTFALKNNFLQQQGDIEYWTTTNYNAYTSITGNTDEERNLRKVVNTLYNNQKFKQIVYFRSVLKNQVIEYDVSPSGWEFNTTLIVTARVMPMDYTDGNGWLTVFYLTDSYDDNSRAHDVRCKYYRIANTLNEDDDGIDNDDIKNITHYHVDFGTLHVYIKEILNVDEKIAINCLIPINSRNFVGYLPKPAPVRQLRIATWSYDETTPDGADMYEFNNNHAIQPLVPIDAASKQMVIFNFQVPSTIIGSESKFIQYFDQIFDILNTIKKVNRNGCSQQRIQQFDENGGCIDFDFNTNNNNQNNKNENSNDEFIFSPNKITSENVYSILNYKIRNHTTSQDDGYQIAPYQSMDITSLQGTYASVAFGFDYANNDEDAIAYFENVRNQINLVFKLQYPQLQAVFASVNLDKVYLNSLGLNNCGGVTQRKCMYGGVCTSHTNCGADGECHYDPKQNNNVIIKKEPKANVFYDRGTCWDGGLTINPFDLTSAAFDMLSLRTVMMSVVVVCIGLLF